MIAFGALSASAGAALRASGSGGGTFLLDAAGWLIAAAGAVLEARSAGMWFDIQPTAVRRRAVAFASLGVIGALGGCIAASVFSSDRGALLQSGAMLALVGGVGFGLAGFGALAWTIGGDYAARRIEQLGDDDW